MSFKIQSWVSNNKQKMDTKLNTNIDKLNEISKLNFKNYFGQDLEDVIWKSIICSPLPDSKSSFDNEFKWRLEWFKSILDEKTKKIITYLDVVDQEDNHFDIEFIEVDELDWFLYNPIRVDFSIQTENWNDYTLANSTHKDLIDFLDDWQILENELNATKDDIKKIYVCHYALDSDENCIDLEWRDYEMSVEELYSWNFNNINKIEENIPQVKKDLLSLWMKEEDIELNTWNSDIHIKVNDISKKYFQEHEYYKTLKDNPKMFRSEIDGTMWYDLFWWNELWFKNNK